MRRDQGGASAVEYGLIAALIAVASIAVMRGCAPKEEDCPAVSPDANGVYAIPSSGCATIGNYTMPDQEEPDAPVSNLT